MKFFYKEKEKQKRQKKIEAEEEVKRLEGENIMITFIILSIFMGKKVIVVI